MTTTMESLNWVTYASDDPHSKAGLERFRRSVWPRIRRQLALELLWEVPDGAEPHWFDAGTARFWHQLVSPRGVQGPWELTFPLPANTAGQIAHYLAKGFRLRPPHYSVEARRVESAEEPVAPSAPPAKPTYWCNRHGHQHYGFATWSAYLAHCSKMMESLEEELPAEELERLTQAPYACMVHGLTFVNERSANQHYREAMRRPGRAVHPSVAEMEMRPTTTTEVVEAEELPPRQLGEGHRHRFENNKSGAPCLTRGCEVTRRRVTRTRRK